MRIGQYVVKRLLRAQSANLGLGERGVERRRRRAWKDKDIYSEDIHIFAKGPKLAHSESANVGLWRIVDSA